MTRTPLRISIGGGGTDLPSYYRENGGGFVISAAITKYVYITVNRSFLPGYFLKYSETEHADTCDEIRHPLMREAIRMHHAPSPLEMVSVADVPAGTGLGSSGTFLVGLLHALYAWQREPVTAEILAQEAIDIEMNRLGEPVGKQDQYIAAYGGLLCQEYFPDGEVRVTPLHMSRGIAARDCATRSCFSSSAKPAAHPPCWANRSASPRLAIPPCSTVCTLPACSAGRFAPFSKPATSPSSAASCTNTGCASAPAAAPCPTTHID